MSDDLEAAAIDGIMSGDFRPVVPLLLAHGGLAYNLLAMLMAGGHIKLEVQSGKRSDIGISTATAMEHLSIGRFIAEQELHGGGTEAAKSAAMAKFGIEESTAKRAKALWVKLTAGPFPHHLLDL
jgi:hypothetical protein